MIIDISDRILPKQYICTMYIHGVSAKTVDVDWLLFLFRYVDNVKMGNVKMRNVKLGNANILYDTHINVKLRNVNV